MRKTSLTLLLKSVWLLWLFGTCTYAQGLDSLVNEALVNNPELSVAKARWEQARYRVPQAASLKDPTLSFALSNYPSDSLSSSATPMTGNEVKLAQMFPFPGKLANRSALAEEQAHWFEAVYADNHYRVARMVKDAWYRLYSNEQSIKVVERNLALVDDIVRLAEVRYETGSGLQQDVLKAQLQRSKLMKQLMSLQQQGTSIQAELNRLVNREEFALFEAPKSLELPVVGHPVDHFLHAGAVTRPMNNAYKSLIHRYRLQERLAALDDYPDVTLWGSWRFRDDGLPDKGTDFVSAGVSLNLPVYRDKRRAARAEAVAAIRMAERQYESFKNDVAKSIRQAFARAKETFEQAELYRSGIIHQSSQSFQAALSAYQVGQVTFNGMLDALMDTFNTELDYYRAQSEYMRSLAQLEAESTVSLTGETITIDIQE